MDATIYCDESGYTGDNLLEKNQPYFVFSGVCLTDDLKAEIKDFIYSNYRVQGEIKGRNIVKNEPGKKVILELFRRYSKTARIVYHEKKYALAAKIFEYAIEPNLLSNSMVYQTGFHIYISLGLYYYFIAYTEEAESIFQSFLDTVKGETKNSIFDIKHKDKSFLLWWVLEIVKFNPQKFYDEITVEGKVSPFILELTSTSLQAILTEYGRMYQELDVICDHSNLYKDNSVIESLNMIGEHGERAEFLGQPLGFKLKRNIQTLNSKKDVGLQIPDVFATGVGHSLTNADTDFAKEIKEITLHNCLCTPTYCVVADREPYWSEGELLFYERFMKMIWDVQGEGAATKRIWYEPKA